MDKFMELVTPRRTIICNNEKELRGLCRLLANRGFTCYKNNANPFQLVHIVSEKDYPVQVEVFTFSSGITYNQCFISIIPALEYIPMKEVREILRMSTNSTREWVRDNLPESWCRIAEKYRVKEELLRRICATIPVSYRNTRSVREGRRFVRNRIFGVRAPLIHLIDMTDADIEKWKNISYEILQYEESCR